MKIDLSTQHFFLSARHQYNLCLPHEFCLNSWQTLRSGCSEGFLSTWQACRSPIPSKIKGIGTGGCCRTRIESAPLIARDVYLKIIMWINCGEYLNSGAKYLVHLSCWLKTNFIPLNFCALLSKGSFHLCFLSYTRRSCPLVLTSFILLSIIKIWIKINEILDVSDLTADNYWVKY